MNCKKVLLCLIGTMLLSGCNMDFNTSEKNAAYKEFEDNYPNSFVYTYESDKPGKIAISDDGRMVITEPKKSDGFGVEFIEFTMDGKKRKICDYNNYPEMMMLDGSFLYIAQIKWNNKGLSEGISINRIHIESGETEHYNDYNIPLEFGYGMSGNKNGEIFIIGEDYQKSSDIKCEYPGFIDSHYSVFLLRGEHFERLPVDFPTAVCAKKSGGAVIAGCDDKGYYIVVYENGEFSDKIYSENPNGRIDGLADIDGKHLLYTAFTSSDNYTLCASDISSFSSAELLPEVNVLGDRIFSAGGYCFFEPSENGKENKRTVERIKFSAYYKDNPPMNLLTTDLSGSTPFGCGYTINIQNSSQDEAALKILSHDKDFDMCYISSRDSISYSIKDKGSFYPLNDVGRVAEYIDKCFLSIKESFIDDRGNIWAFPVCSSSTFLFNNSGDVDFSSMTLDEFADYIDKLSDNETGKTFINAFNYTQTILMDYLMKQNSFDTVEFRNAAKKLKETVRLNYAVLNHEQQGLLNRDEHLLSMYTNDLLLKYGAGQEFTVSGIPCIYDNNVMLINVVFLCVNPYSEHLSYALDYISNLAEYQLTNPNQFVLTSENGVYSETKTVQQMIDLCESSDICFSYPEELYWDDFYNYLSGKITLDEFITEADRKLKTYLNE